jgi:hypothetical protein
MFAEIPRAWLLGPRLCPDFRPGDGRCVVDLRESPNSASPECRWARVSVINCGRGYLRNCQAFVSNIEQEQSGEWVKTNPQFVDPLGLEWAATPVHQRYNPRDVPRETEFFINVVASAESPSQNDSLTLSVEHWPDRLKKIFESHRRYRITVTVTGDQVKPRTVKVIVNWTGSWRFDTSRG